MQKKLTEINISILAKDPEAAIDALRDIINHINPSFEDFGATHGSGTKYHVSLKKEKAWVKYENNHM